MIYRTAEQKLLKLAKTYKVVAITGPRQSGKTTLAKNVFDNKDFISFDDNNIRKIASQDSVNFVKGFKDGAIFDEAQKVPEIFEAIKLVVDNENSYGKFILTGSSQFKINHNIHESLAGRVGLLNLLSLSISELSHSSLLPDSVFELAINGLYPEIYNIATSTTSNNTKDSTTDSNANLDEKIMLNKTAINIADISRSYYTNYVDTYLTMDARELINIGNLESYSDFVKLCAHYSGQIVNYEKISRKLGVSAVTVKK